MNWWPDANITARAERLRAERRARCAHGLHDDPDNSGMCILCGVVLAGLVPDFGAEDDGDDDHGG